MFSSGGLSTSNLDFLQNLDNLKESVRLAGSGGYDWQNIDISQFQGKQYCENLPMRYTEIFLAVKTENFVGKIVFVLILSLRTLIVGTC